MLDFDEPQKQTVFGVDKKEPPTQEPPTQEPQQAGGRKRRTRRPRKTKNKGKHTKRSH